MTIGNAPASTTIRISTESINRHRHRPRPVKGGEKGNNMRYRVIVDISPRTIPGTNGCHKYVFKYFRTKREADASAEALNAAKDFGKATVEKV